MERVVRIQKARNRLKKYTAITSLGRSISFGAIGYPQYKDSTALALYRKGDTLDPKRRRAYFMRQVSMVDPQW